jgi:DNA (cytosine-5)-methyltransferase 1
LAGIGYDCLWDCVQASSLGAPHQRKRLFAIAYDPGNRVQTRKVLDTSQRRNPFELRVSDTRYVSGHPWSAGQPPFVGVDDGVSHWVDRSKGLGNAVVPQVAQHIGEIILRMEEEWGTT